MSSISNALVVHYKLDGSDISEGTTNIATYPTPGAAVSPGWDTSKHPGAISVTGWSNGYNGGVTNPTAGYHAMWKIIDDIPTIVFQDMNSEIGSTHRWLGVTGGGITTSQITSNTTYTISFDAKANVEGKNVSVGLYYTQTSGGSNAFHDGCTEKTITTDWQRYSWTYTTSTVYSIHSIYIYGHYGVEGISYVRNIQVEIKNHATPYTKTSRDTIIYDQTTNENHGIMTGTFSTNNNSPKNSASLTFNTTSSKIKLPTLNFTSMANSYTFSWWQYNTGTGNMPWGFSDGNRLNFYHCSPICWNTGDSANNPFINNGTTIDPTSLQNAWHHIVITGDGGSTKLYIDGTFRGTATTYKPLTGTQIWLSGWDSGTSYTMSGSRESDFRIYNKVLTANDIQGLYSNFPIGIYVKVNNNIKKASSLYIKINGAWKLIKLDGRSVEILNGNL